MPAAVSLQKKGANKGAVTSFLISTPESGIDSIAVTYALLDPILTVARPLAAFVTAAVAGVTVNLLDGGRNHRPVSGSPPDGNSHRERGTDDPQEHEGSFAGRISAGLRYAVTEFWEDLAGWFFLGLVVAGGIAALMPQDIFTRYLGSGLTAMLLMLAAGIPLYICATASTPIAAALILKGVSPGAALVFLLAGPATNTASMAMMLGLLGRRALAVYLVAIGGCAVLSGLVLDRFYDLLGLSAQAVVGRAAEQIPSWVETAAAVVLILLSFNYFRKKIAAVLGWLTSGITRGSSSQPDTAKTVEAKSCDCRFPSNESPEPRSPH